MFASKKPTVHRMTSDKPKVIRPAFSPNRSSPASRSAHTALTALEPLSFPVFPTLSNSSPDQIDSLFREKCKSCLQKCSFTDPSHSSFISGKEEILKEICSALENPQISLANDLLNWESVGTLIAAHIFRVPQSPPPEWFSFYDFFAMSDSCHPPEWRHHSLIYDIAIAFFKRMKCDINEKLAIAGDFLKLAVYLARTPDDREQGKVTRLFLAIYENVIALRQFGWRVVESALSRILYETEPFVAAKAILAALGGIIAGLKTPLDPKHLPFFFEVLMPLHRNQFLFYFSKELLTCVWQYLEKDGSLVVAVFQTVIRYWPRLQPQKQMIMLDEITYFSSFVEEEWLVQCVRIVCPQLMISLSSCNSGISEKVLSMWEVNDFVWLMTSNPAVTYPIVCPTVYETGRSYWQPEIRFLAAAVLKTMQANDERAFDAVGKNLRKIQSLEIMKGFNRAAKWKYLIYTYEPESRMRNRKLHFLSVLFPGCEGIDPLRKV
jgi:serine/threonine-protein phosphatase 2A regulatory subunit B'